VRNDTHMGVRFQVWNGQQGWLWYVVGPDRKGGAIGVAANEMEALREARWSIEELATRPGTDAVSFLTDSSASAPDEAPLKVWNELLAKLNRYLSQVRRHTV